MKPVKPTAIDLLRQEMDQPLALRKTLSNSEAQTNLNTTLGFAILELADRLDELEPDFGEFCGLNCLTL